METKQQSRMEPIQQNHPTRGKQTQDYDWNIQISRNKTIKEYWKKHSRNKKNKNRQAPKNQQQRNQRSMENNERNAWQIPYSMQIL